MKSFRLTRRPFALTMSVLALMTMALTLSYAKPAPIEITMMNKGYHIKSGGYSGGMTPGFTLTVG